MVVNEEINEEKFVRNKQRDRNQGYVYVMGKKLTRKKVQKKVKGATICSVKDLASTSVSGVCVFLTPSSKADYQEARKLAEGGCSTVIVNGLFKVSCSELNEMLATLTPKYYV